jgi:hypothetical protein
MHRASNAAQLNINWQVFSPQIVTAGSHPAAVNASINKGTIPVWLQR